MAHGGWRFHPQLCDDSWGPLGTWAQTKWSKWSKCPEPGKSSARLWTISQVYLQTAPVKPMWRCHIGTGVGYKNVVWFRGLTGYCTSDCDVCGVDTIFRCRNFGCFTFFNHICKLTFQESFRIPRTQWVFHMEMSQELGSNMFQPGSIGEKFRGSWQGAVSAGKPWWLCWTVFFVSLVINSDW